MMLIDADGIEPDLGGVFELVHEVVVHVMGTLGVEQFGVDIHPHGRVLRAEILRQLGVGHQMEPHQLHGRSPTDDR